MAHYTALLLGVSLGMVVTSSYAAVFGTGNLLHRLYPNSPEMWDVPVATWVASRREQERQQVQDTQDQSSGTNVFANTQGASPTAPSLVNIPRAPPPSSAPGTILDVNTRIALPPVVNTPFTGNNQQHLPLAFVADTNTNIIIATGTSHMALPPTASRQSPANQQVISSQPISDNLIQNKFIRSSNQPSDNEQRFSSQHRTSNQPSDNEQRFSSQHRTSNQPSDNEQRFSSQHRISNRPSDNEQSFSYQLSRNPLRFPQTYGNSKTNNRWLIQRNRRSEE